MKHLLAMSMVLALMLAASTAWGAVQVLASFDDDAGMSFVDKATATAEIVAGGTPGPSSTKCARITVSADDFNYWPEDTPPYMFITGLDFSPALDMTAHNYINFYIKGTSSNPIEGQWISATNASATSGSGIGSASPELPADWTYVSYAIDDFEDQWKAWPDMSAVPRLQWVFVHSVAGTTMTLYLDHITLSDTPAEGMIPAGPAPEVLADFEDQSSLDYFAWTVTPTPSSDTPSDDSLWSTSYPVTMVDWGAYDGLLYEPNKDFTTHEYVNFYMKATGTPSSHCYVQLITQDWGAAMGWDLDMPLPASWTYFSLALDDAVEMWGGDPHDMTAVWKLEFAFDDPLAEPATIFLDHITLTTTPAEGRLTPKDCGTPRIAGANSTWVEAGSPLTLTLEGLNPDCVDTVTWTRDGMPVGTGNTEPCGYIKPAGSGVGDTVSISVTDPMGNPASMAAEDGYAEVGFKKNGDPAPITFRIDHVTMSDSSAAGMLGAGSGLVYVLSDCGETDELGYTNAASRTVVADGAGTGSTASVELECTANSEIWSEWYDSSWGGSGPLDCTGATHFNFYLKVVSGTLPSYNLVEIGTCETANEWWDVGARAGIEDGVAFPAVGAGWVYISIPIASMNVDPGFDPAFVRAAGMKWDLGGTPDVYNIFNNGDNPELFETGEAVITLTQEMVDSYYAWIWAEGPGYYMEFFPLASALANGYDCDSPIWKGLDDVSTYELTFDSLSESDSGTYCASLTLNGDPVEVCRTLEVVAEGALPVAGVVGLGVLVLSCIGAGWVALRRKE